MNNKITTTKSESILNFSIQNKFVFVFFVLIFILISSILTAFQKMEYSSTAKVLVIQNQQMQMDAYIASKSSEAITKNLSDAILSSSFRAKVIEKYPDTPFVFYASEKQKRNYWKKQIDVKIIPNTSILEIKTYNESAFNAEKFLNNVVSTLFEYHKDYHGAGDLIKLQIIDNPVTSNYPVRPNWFVNLFMSLMLAIFFNISFMMLFPNKYTNFDVSLNNFFNSDHKRIKTNQKIKLVFNQAEIEQEMVESENLNMDSQSKNITDNIDFDELRKRLLNRNN
ncbi:MAG TPA: Wzz/FepE/Etk N-terminal domain-containing protein [bacterium]|nr:Wzz/FepE/Etk N-terminal domain-containing protein [bacterium]